MFDIGFSEFILIALLALIVLGPKRLPEAARSAGRMVARLRNFIANVRQDFDHQLASEDLSELRKLKQEISETRQLLQDSSEQILQGVSDDFNGSDDPLLTDTGPEKPGKKKRAKRISTTKKTKKLKKKQPKITAKSKKTTKKKKRVTKKARRG